MTRPILDPRIEAAITAGKAALKAQREAEEEERKRAHEAKLQLEAVELAANEAAALIWFEQLPSNIEAFAASGANRMEICRWPSERPRVKLCEAAGLSVIIRYEQWHDYETGKPDGGTDVWEIHW